MTKYPRNPEDINAYITRLKVHGGWVVSEWFVVKEKDVCSSTVCFVPDARHEWELEEG